MTTGRDVEQVVTEWLRADASPTNADLVLAAALGRVATTRQDQRGGRRPLVGWLGGRVGSRLAVVALLVLLAAIVATVVGTQLPAPAPPPTRDPFSTGPSPIVPRVDHTATLLADGSVLNAGGYGSDMPRTVELFGPTSQTYRTAGSLLTPRLAHTATLLRDGRVLIVGGDQFNSTLASAEIWDPATGTSTPTGDLLTGRSGHSATLLEDGRVLIVGGRVTYPQQVNLASAEVWDPVSGAFASAGSLPDERWGHAAALLNDGRVLIVGREAEPCSRTAGQLWDPVTQSFDATRGLDLRSAHPTATVLPDGRVLVVGGWDFADARSDQRSFMVGVAWLWDPVTETSIPAGSLEAPRSWHTATLLRDGRVLIVGGTPLEPTAVVWDMTSMSFAPAGSVPYSRYPHTATLLPDGRVLISGGVNRIWDPEVPLPTTTESSAPATPVVQATEPPRQVGDTSPWTPADCGP